MFPAIMPVKAVIEREAQMNNSIRSVSSSIAGAHGASPAFSAASLCCLNTVAVVRMSPPFGTRQRCRDRQRYTCTLRTAIILGGGAGSRLYPLTKQRAKPAVPIGGAYRLIDVPMSNCINSGISKIYVLTQFNSTSLNRHLARTYNFGNGEVFYSEGASAESFDTLDPQAYVVACNCSQ
jgi:Nucleotidyl transferase